MGVDVQCELEILRPRAEVAEYASHPDNTTVWYANIEAVVRETPRPLAVESQLTFVAIFLGRPLSYTYEIRELLHRERVVMSTAGGPFPMETTYTWHNVGNRATRMTLRNPGTAVRLRENRYPLLARAMRRAMTADRRCLSEILQRRGRHEPFRS